MYLDLLDQVMSSYAPTSTGATFQNYLDRLIKMENASGNPLGAYINVAAAVTSSGSATVQFQLIGNPTDPTFASGNIVLGDSGAIAKTVLVAGYQIPLAMNHVPFGSLESAAVKCRYLTILVTIGTAALTAGTFNGWITGVPIVNDNVSYAAGYTV